MRPFRTYLVCATPRSGSTLLCAVLASTGRAGRPEEFFEARCESGIPRRPREYFKAASGLPLARVPDVDPPTPPYSDLRAVMRWREHFERSLRAGSTPNGVFGAKVMWMHLSDLARFAGTPRAEVLERLFPDATFVWVRRADRVRQAISLWKAMQTRVWRAEAERPTAPPFYDRAAIDHLTVLLDRHDELWARQFEDRAIDPLTLVYEEIAADPPAAARAVLDAIGVEAPIASGVAPLERQADELSEQWAEQHMRGAA